MYEKIKFDNRTKHKIKEIYDYFDNEPNLPFKITYSMILKACLTDEVIEQSYEVIENLIEKARINKEKRIEEKARKKEKRKQGYPAFY